MAKDPGDRPPAEEVARALAVAGGFQLRPSDDDSSVSLPAASFLGPEPRESDPSDMPVSDPMAAEPATKGRRRVLVVAAAVAVLALTALGIMLSGYLGNGAPQAAGGTQGAHGGGTSAGPVLEPAHNQSGAAGTVGPSGKASAGGPAAAFPGAPNQPLPSGSGADPTTSPPNIAPSSPGVVSSPTPPVVEATLRSAGGTVLAACQGTLATLEEITPADGYVVKNSVKGPADVVGVVFKPTSGTNVRMKIKCKNGVPVTNNSTE